MKNGTKVKFINEWWHAKAPEYYPPVGTVGEIINSDDRGICVHWPEGVTIGAGCWWCTPHDVELVEENKE